MSIAPEKRFASLPFLKKMIVGTLLTPQAAASSHSCRASIFAQQTVPHSFLVSRSINGVIMIQGVQPGA